jgi:hypothetical protein
MSVKWSFSGLKDFVNCPKQYHEVKILQKFTKAVTEQMMYGTTVHKALEDYTRDGTPLAKNYERFRPMMDELLSIPGTRHPELKMALDSHRKPISFDGDYWVRGIVDLLIVDNNDAFIVDYKTGSAKYPDSKQLKLMALMTFAHFPEVQKIKAGLLFVLHDVFVTEEYSRADIPTLWEAFALPIARLEAAVESGNFPANPTPLCGWCPVTTCEFFKRRRTY